MARYHFEDLVVGGVQEYGGRTVSREEIVAFAREFDPQPFHVDEEAARRSVYGGLIASGWHTVALCMRMLVDGFVNESASLGSPGADEIRWPRFSAKNGAGSSPSDPATPSTCVSNASRPLPRARNRTGAAAASATKSGTSTARSS